MEVKLVGDHLPCWGLACLAPLQMAARAAIELNVFSIIADAGPEAHLSAAEITSKMATTNPKSASTNLDRLLRFLGANSLLTMAQRPFKNGEDIHHEWTYGLTKQTCSLATNSEAGISSDSSILLCFSGKEIVESMYMLKDSVLDPGRSAFYRTHGVHPYEYMEKKPTLKRSFNGFIESTSRAILDEVLKVYGGFEDVKELLDVGGSAGASLGKILSVYPHIRGLNLDLAHVIADAPSFPGVEHIAGDMFRSLPHTQTILLQRILHNWDDDHCKKLLRNCWEALPDDGKVIVVESVIPQVLANDTETRYAVASDLCMMLLLVGGKERTISEIDNLAKAVGFVETKDFPIAKSIHVIELRKKVMRHP